MSVSRKWISKLSVVSALLISSQLSVSEVAHELPTTLCTDNITSFTASNGCLIKPPAGMTADADMGIKIFTPLSVGDPAIEQNVKKGLEKVVLYAGGFSGKNVRSLEMEDLKEFLCEGVSVVNIQSGGAGKDTVEDISAQVQVIIQKLNTFRAANSNNKKMVYIGHSLGAIAGKHALATMEKNNKLHNFGTYISYDAPHRGANVPQSIQQMKGVLDDYLREAQAFGLKYSSKFNIPTFVVKSLYTTVQEALDDISSEYVESSVLDQLLVNNVFASDVKFKAFAASYNALGYPKETRNIAVSNGSLSNKQIGYDNGNTLVDFSAATHEPPLRGRVDLKIYPSKPNMKSMDMNLVLEGVDTRTYKCFFFFTCTQSISIGGNLPKSRVANSSVIPLDDVPGSYSPNISLVIAKMTYFANGVFKGYIKSPYYDSAAKKVKDIKLVNREIVLENENNVVNFSFTPTASALDLPVNTSIDELKNAVNNKLTPFDLVIIKGDLSHHGVENKNFHHSDKKLTAKTKEEIRLGLQKL